MTDGDVSEDDMYPHEFSDDDAEAMIEGGAPRDPVLGAALDEMRSTFSAIVSRGRRLKLWKMKPISSPRSLARPSGSIVALRIRAVASGKQ